MVMVKKRVALIIMSFFLYSFVASKVITSQSSLLAEAHFKKDFMVYIKFLCRLPREELLSPLVLEDIASLYRDGRFYNDSELNACVGSLMTTLATKAARPGVSYGARQFVADIVSDYGASSQGKSIELEYLVDKIARVHEREEEARIARDEHDAQSTFLKRIKKEEQEDKRTSELFTKHDETPFYFGEHKIVRKKSTSKKVSSAKPKKTADKKSEKQKKVEKAQQEVVLNDAPIVRAKRGRPKKEEGSVAVKRSKKVLSAPKIATTVKRVRKKTS